MRVKSIAAAVSIALLAVTPLSLAKPTQRCNTSTNNQVWLYGMSAETQSRLAGIANNAASNPEMYSRMWEPLRGDPSTTVLGNRSVILTMDPFQDIQEMVQAMRGDAAFSDVSTISENSLICFEPPPPASHGIAVEYRNRFTNHYFLSTSEGENTIIDAGGAGPGWERTGQSFKFISSAPHCYGQARVYRFYTRGANSHFYTADPVECGGLRTTPSGWIPEGVAFSGTLPVNGQCSSTFSTPVYRLYNNRAAFNDSNHRYTTSSSIYQQMMSEGWAGEGVAICVRQGS